MIFGVAAYFLRDKISGIAESLIRRGTGLSGRDMLYEEGVELFKQHPIFGVGIGYIGTGPCPITTMQIYLYHSTAIQIIASTGAIGLPRTLITTRRDFICCSATADINSICLCLRSG